MKNLSEWQAAPKVTGRAEDPGPVTVPRPTPLTTQCSTRGIPLLRYSAITAIMLWSTCPQRAATCAHGISLLRTNPIASVLFFTSMKQQGVEKSSTWMVLVTLENVPPCIMLGRTLPQGRVSHADNLAHNLLRPTFTLPPGHLLSSQGIETGTSSSGLPQETHKSTRNCGQWRHSIFSWTVLK